MAQKTAGWRSGTNETGEQKGFNDAGIEHFNENPLAAIAKEPPQNAKDAGLEGLPVHIRVRVLKISTSSFPDVVQLLHTLNNCLKSEAAKSDKVRRFFEKAIEILSSATIDVLAITDTNTKGAGGPCEPGKPFYALMKSTGSTVKENELSLGSFGIGKMAPYANSAIRTVFVSTTYKDDEGILRRLVQGKSILVSHQDGETSKDANSYWGQCDGYQPIDPDEMDAPNVPEWLLAEHGEGETGTTVFIPAFNAFDGWEKEFLAYFLSTFFDAVHDGTATADIAGHMVNSETIGDLFADEDLGESIAWDENAHEAFRIAKACYAAISDENAETISGEFGRLGHATLSLLVGEGLPQKIGVIRNGMFITDALPGLIRFSAMAGFAGVLRFNTGDTNELLRKMEPPRHDAFELARLNDDPVMRDHARLGLKEVAKRVRSEIEERARGEVSERLNLSELADMLGEPDDGTRKSDSPESNPLGRLKIQKAARLLARRGKQKSHVKSVSIGEGAVADATGSVHIRKNKPHVPNPTPSSGPDENDSGVIETSGEDGKDGRAKVNDGEMSFSDFALKGIRGVRDSTGQYRVSFVAPADTLFGFKFEPVGYAKTDGPMPVSSVSGAEIDSHGMVLVPGQAGKKVSLSVKFADPSYNGAVKVLSYAV